MRVAGSGVDGSGVDGSGVDGVAAPGAEGPGAGEASLGSAAMADGAGGIRDGVRTWVTPGAAPVPAPRDIAGDPAAPTVDGKATTATFEGLGRGRGLLREGPDGPGHRVLLLPSEGNVPRREPGVERWEVVVDGWRVEVDVEASVRAALRDRARRGREAAGTSGPTNVHAIIPGVVVSVSVAAGDAVTAGQQLLVVEAMKMQNELRAPRDGTIDQVAVGAGTTIEVGDLLLVIE